MKLKNSEIISRAVYVKESRGMKMVRKFMVWKTNKEATGEYPAYVYHYTDFSATRKEMLIKEIKVSDSKKQIEEIFAAELAENVKKGWEKVYFVKLLIHATNLICGTLYLPMHPIH